MIAFVLQHPIVILYLAAGWLVAAIISVMPPLPPNCNYFVRWLYNIAQVFGASLDKVGHIAAQSTAFKQVASSLETTAADGSKKLETSNVVTQAAAPAAPPPATL
jgi:hypothetical protein